MSISCIGQILNDKPTKVWTGRQLMRLFHPISQKITAASPSLLIRKARKELEKVFPHLSFPSMSIFIKELNLKNSPKRGKNFTKHVHAILFCSLTTVMMMTRRMTMAYLCVSLDKPEQLDSLTPF